MLSFLKKKTTPLTNIFPSNFMDIHNHLIPEIDDGAKTLNDSVELIKRMYSYGIKNFMCTPHIMGGVYDNTPEIINQKLNELQAHLKTIGLNDIQIKVAAEYMLDDQFESLLKEKKLLTLKDNLVLVELSYHSAPINLYEQLFNIQIAGYQPVLAHPERYSFFHNHYKEYKKLKEVGCLFQLNLLSLSNYYGTGVHAVALKLLNDSLIDFVGSDTHHHKHLNALENINNPKIIKLISPILKKNEIIN